MKCDTNTHGSCPTMTTLTLSRGTKFRAVNVSAGGGYTVLFARSFFTNAARFANDGFEMCCCKASLQQELVRVDISSSTSGVRGLLLIEEVKLFFCLFDDSTLVFPFVVTSSLRFSLFSSLVLSSDVLRFFGAKKEVIIFLFFM